MQSRLFFLMYLDISLPSPEWRFHPRHWLLSLERRPRFSDLWPPKSSSFSPRRIGNRKISNWAVSLISQENKVFFLLLLTGIGVFAGIRTWNESFSFSLLEMNPEKRSKLSFKTLWKESLLLLLFETNPWKKGLKLSCKTLSKSGPPPYALPNWNRMAFTSACNASHVDLRPSTRLKN